MPSFIYRRSGWGNAFALDNLFYLGCLGVVCRLVFTCACHNKTFLSYINIINKRKMPRKKEKILSLEVIEVNSTWDYRETKTLNNFICKKDDAEKTIVEMDRKECWKHETGYKDQVKAILSDPGTRSYSDVFFNDDVNVEEVKLPASVKSGTKYVYKIYDYSGDRVNTEYGTQKEILAYLGKKIKTKYAYVFYNGTRRKIEYSPKAVTDILNELEETTSQFTIEPIGRAEAADNAFLVTMFKNCMK
jgi:hypothetical protein